MQPGEQYSQAGHVSGCRIYRDSGFLEHPVGVKFSKTDIPGRPPSHRAASSGHHVSVGSAVSGGGVPGVWGGAGWCGHGGVPVVWVRVSPWHCFCTVSPLYRVLASETPLYRVLASETPLYRVLAV